MIDCYSETRGEPILRNHGGDHCLLGRLTPGTLAAAFAPALLWAATASARGLSFSEARRVAERRAPEAQLAELRRAGARADVESAAALSTPTVAVTTATQTAKLGTSLS